MGRSGHMVTTATCQPAASVKVATTMAATTMADLAATTAAIWAAGITAVTWAAAITAADSRAATPAAGITDEARLLVPGRASTSQALAHCHVDSGRFSMRYAWYGKPKIDGVSR
jgi:hypothetical protein